jgi:hypothetical protein
MATKKTSCGWALVVLGCWLTPLPLWAATERGPTLAPEANEFQHRRDYLRSRYEDFYMHYDFLYRYDSHKMDGSSDLRVSRQQVEREKEKARKEYLRTRKTPGPYLHIEDGSEKAMAEAKEREPFRREFIQNRAALERLEKSVPSLPENVSSGLVDPLQND